MRCWWKKILGCSFASQRRCRPQSEDRGPPPLPLEYQIPVSQPLVPYLSSFSILSTSINHRCGPTPFPPFPSEFLRDGGTMWHVPSLVPCLAFTPVHALGSCHVGTCPRGASLLCATLRSARSPSTSHRCPSRGHLSKQSSDSKRFSDGTPGTTALMFSIIVNTSRSPQPRAEVGDWEMSPPGSV